MRTVFSLLFILFLGWGCASLPDPKVTKYTFPKNAFIGDVKRPYSKLGMVKTKVNFNSLDWKHEEKFLCKNAFNQAARELVKLAEKQGADAVIKVQSITFYEMGGHQMHDSAECSDDGQEGQVLAAGLAVKWLPDNNKSEEENKK